MFKPVLFAHSVRRKGSSVLISISINLKRTSVNIRGYKTLNSLIDFLKLMIVDPLCQEGHTPSSGQNGHQKAVISSCRLRALRDKGGLDQTRRARRKKGLFSPRRTRRIHEERLQDLKRASHSPGYHLLLFRYFSCKSCESCQSSSAPYDKRWTPAFLLRSCKSLSRFPCGERLWAAGSAIAFPLYLQ